MVVLLLFPLYLTSHHDRILSLHFSNPIEIEKQLGRIVTHILLATHFVYNLYAIGRYI